MTTSLKKNENIIIINIQLDYIKHIDSMNRKTRILAKKVFENEVVVGYIMTLLNCKSLMNLCTTNRFLSGMLFKCDKNIIKRFYSIASLKDDIDMMNLPNEKIRSERWRKHITKLFPQLMLSFNEHALFNTLWAIRLCDYDLVLFYIWNIPCHETEIELSKFFKMCELLNYDLGFFDVYGKWGIHQHHEFCDIKINYTIFIVVYLFGDEYLINLVINHMRHRLDNYWTGYDYCMSIRCKIFWWDTILSISHRNLLCEVFGQDDSHYNPDKVTYLNVIKNNMMVYDLSTTIKAIEKKRGFNFSEKNIDSIHLIGFLRVPIVLIQIKTRYHKFVVLAIIIRVIIFIFIHE